MKTTHEDGHTWTHIRCAGCGTTAKFPSKCGKRFCEICGLARRKRVKFRAEWMIGRMRRDKHARLRFVTFTMRSQTDMRKMTVHLIKSFRRVRQSKLWKRKVFGGCYFVEFKPSKTVDNAWHVHLHVLAYGWYINDVDLQKIWSKAVGAESFVKSKLIPLGAAVNYVLKYVTKMPTEVTALGDEAEAAVERALKGLRLFQPFGDWQGASQGAPKPCWSCTACKCTDWVLEASDFETAWRVPYSSDVMLT